MKAIVVMFDSLNRHMLPPYADTFVQAPNFERLAARSVRVLGTVAEWLARGDDALYVIGVGSPAARGSLRDRLDAAGRRAATLVHPRAGVGSASSIGEGSVICAGVEISTNVRIGRHVHLNPSATIGHDTVIDDLVSVNPAAVVSGDVAWSFRSIRRAASGWRERPQPASRAARDDARPAPPDEDEDEASSLAG